MLPSGTSHIDLSGIGSFPFFSPLNNYHLLFCQVYSLPCISCAGAVARALGIDYAEAVVGFRHGVTDTPITSGIVVCEESRTLLLEAWEMRQVADQELEVIFF